MAFSHSVQNALGGTVSVTVYEGGFDNMSHIRVTDIDLLHDCDDYGDDEVPAAEV